MNVIGCIDCMTKLMGASFNKLMSGGEILLYKVSYQGLELIKTNKLTLGL